MDGKTRCGRAGLVKWRVGEDVVCAVRWSVWVWRERGGEVDRSGRLSVSGVVKREKEVGGVCAG